MSAEWCSIPIVLLHFLRKQTLLQNKRCHGVIYIILKHLESNLVLFVEILVFYHSEQPIVKYSLKKKNENWKLKIENEELTVVHKELCVDMGLEVSNVLLNSLI